MQITSSSVFRFLQDSTHPQHPYYHPFQIFVFASTSYVSAAYLTSVSPARSAKAAILVYLISRLTTPLFIQLFEPYREIPLAPLIGQVFQLTATLASLKTIYFLAGHPLSFKEIRQLSIPFLIAICFSRFLILRFYRQHQRRFSNV